MGDEELISLVREVLQKLTVAVGDIRLIHDGPHERLAVNSSDSGILIGQNGEHLRALNTLVKRIVERRAATPLSLLVDVNEYHGRRLEELRTMARLLAERARTFKYDVEMSPMNAYERMIIHAAFANDPEISTESQGEGKFRRVVLRYHPKGSEKRAEHSFQE